MTDSIEKFYIILNTIQSESLRCESLSLTYIGEDDLELCFAEGTPLETKIDGSIPEVVEKFQQLLSIPNLIIGALDFYFDNAQARRYEPYRARLIDAITSVITSQQICRNINWLTIDSKKPLEVLQILGLLANVNTKNFTMITADDPEHPTPIEMFQNIPKTKVQNVELEDLQKLLKHFTKSTTFEKCEITYESLTLQEIRYGFDKDKKVWPNEQFNTISVASTHENCRICLHFDEGKVTFSKRYPEF